MPGRCWSLLSSWLSISKVDSLLFGGWRFGYYSLQLSEKMTLLVLNTVCLVGSRQPSGFWGKIVLTFYKVSKSGENPLFFLNWEKKDVKARLFFHKTKKNIKRGSVFFWGFGGSGIVNWFSDVILFGKGGLIPAASKGCQWKTLRDGALTAFRIGTPLKVQSPSYWPIKLDTNVWYFSWSNTASRWWFQTFFLFSPRTLRKMIPLLTSIFFRWVETTHQALFCVGFISWPPRREW